MTPDAIERFAQALARTAASQLAEASASPVTADLVSATPPLEVHA